MDALEARSFSVVGALTGVITRPDETMRRIAAARPWPIAIALVITIGLLGGLVNLTSPALDPAVLSGGEPIPPAMERVLAVILNPWYMMGAAVILSPLWMVVWTGLLYGIGRLLKGHGAFSALLSTMGFATTPSLLAIPITLVLNLVGGLTGVQLFGSLIGIIFSIWGMVLAVIGIRHSLELSTGRAVATLLIPYAVLFFLACALIMVVIAVAVAAV